MITTHDSKTDRLAAWLLDHVDRGASWPKDRDVAGGDVAAAHRASHAVRALRVARGERAVGYKIGFTNRTIWSRYGMYAPIWGAVYDTTVVWCRGGEAEGIVDLNATCEPRIEPECVFGIARTPPRAASVDALFDCLAWFAPGFEVVQSHAEGWVFTAVETMADGALHARLLIGPATPLTTVAATGTAFDAVLARTSVRLFEGATLRDEGIGANVLDGPLHAAAFFLAELDLLEDAPPLRPGDVLTTGTWTDAWPVAAGQTWHAAFEAPMRPPSVVFR